ncbi:hypothetical protein CGZ77_00120 [Neisseria sp. KEM232]|uniref:hypothetical protein n=1 Tax=unclassified Neisseria TaxID=2623750 RepID=UPI00034CA343|nr:MULTISPECIES: hypothetical protein [unclassified Neisseria]ASP16283.1 hypothetical protein CGZ77_00120 [Neisseria sp. KEM232]
MNEVKTGFQTAFCRQAAASVECAPLSRNTIRSSKMEDTDFDSAMDNLDDALAGFDDVAVEGGFDSDSDDDSCPGGACKI